MDTVDHGVYKAPLPEVLDIVKKTTDLKTVLNLETHSRELITGNGNDLFRACYYKGVRLYDMAWSGIFPPKERDVAVAIRILVHAEKPLIYGCRHTRERGGFLTAAYRMQILGWPFKKAYQAWKDEGCRWPHWWMWKSALKEWEKKR